MNAVQKNLVDLCEPSEIKSLDKILDGYKAYQVVAAALELKLFDWLEKQGEGTREEIVAVLKINGMFARSFLHSLVELGLLTCADEKYANTGLASSFLVSRGEHYQGDWLKMSAGQGSKWNNLSEILTKAEPDMANFEAGPSGDFIKSLSQRSLRGELQAVTKAIAAWEGFSAARRILDLGGGHGLYSIALCQLNPHLKGIVFDKPHVVEYTKEFISKYNLENKLQVQGGDICFDELGTGYDIVIVSHLLYKFRKDLSSIFNKVSTCLNPGGLLVSNHWFCSPGCGAVGALQELDKSLHSFGHPLCHPEDFQDLFPKLGFTVVHTGEVPSANGPSKLHLAIKNPCAAKAEMTAGCCCQC